MPNLVLFLIGGAIGAFAASLIAFPTVYPEMSRRRTRGEAALQALGMPKGSFDFPLAPPDPGWALRSIQGPMPQTVTLRSSDPEVSRLFYQQPIGGGVNAYRICMEAALGLKLTDARMAIIGIPLLIVGFVLSSWGALG